MIHNARQNIVGRDYFETLGIPILSGRAFRKEDEADGATAIIVSEKLWRECWNREDPLGRRIETGSDDAPGAGSDALALFDPRPRAAKARQVFEVVGVVKDMKAAFEMGESPPAIYFPLAPLRLRAAFTDRHHADGARRARCGRHRRRAPRDHRNGPHLAPFHAQSMPEQIDELMFLVHMGLLDLHFRWSVRVDPGVGRTGRSDRVLGGAARARDRHPRGTGRVPEGTCSAWSCGKARRWWVMGTVIGTGWRMGRGEGAIGDGFRRGLGDFRKHVGPAAAGGRSRCCWPASRCWRATCPHVNR